MLFQVNNLLSSFSFSFSFSFFIICSFHYSYKQADGENPLGDQRNLGIGRDVVSCLYEIVKGENEASIELKRKVVNEFLSGIRAVG